MCTLFVVVFKRINPFLRGTQVNRSTTRSGSTAALLKPIERRVYFIFNINEIPVNVIRYLAVVVLWIERG